VIGYYKILIRGRSGEAYNIGAEQPEISIRELADLVVAEARDLFGYQGRVDRRPPPDGDYLADNPIRRCPVIAKAQSELGFNPSVALREGVRRSLIWYAEHSNAAEA